MNIQFVEQWLQKLKDYWYSKNIEGAVSLFNKTTYYQETPFMKPYTTIEEIREEWQHVKDENIQNIQYNILAIDNNKVIVNWFLKQNDEEYDGVYEIEFDDELNCIYFKSWEMTIKEMTLMNENKTNINWLITIYLTPIRNHLFTRLCED